MSAPGAGNASTTGIPITSLKEGKTYKLVQPISGLSQYDTLYYDAEGHTVQQITGVQGNLFVLFSPKLGDPPNGIMVRYNSLTNAQKRQMRFVEIATQGGKRKNKSKRILSNLLYKKKSKSKKCYNFSKVKRNITRRMKHFY